MSGVLPGKPSKPIGLMCAAGLVALAASQAGASILSVSSPFLTVRAQTGSSVGIYTVPASAINVEDLDFDGTDDFFWYESLVAIPVYEGVNQSSGNVVAQVARISASAQQFNFDFDNDNVIDLNYWVLSMDFLVTGGDGTTQFDIWSPIATIGPASNAFASTSATLFGLDTFPADDNVTVQPALSSGYGYEALYNGGPLFREYFNNTMSSSTSTGEAGNMSPPDSFEAVGSTITNFAFRYSFSVSRFDDAGGTAFYGVVPTPGAVALLGIGGLMLTRRRR